MSAHAGKPRCHGEVWEPGAFNPRGCMKRASWRVVGIGEGRFVLLDKVYCKAHIPRGASVLPVEGKP